MLAAQMSLFNETEWSESHKVGAQGGVETTHPSSVEVTPDPAVGLTSSLELRLFCCLLNVNEDPRSIPKFPIQSNGEIMAGIHPPLQTFCIHTLPAIK